MHALLRRVLFGCLILALASAGLAQVGVHYVDRLGLFDTEHTATNGSQSSNIREVNQSATTIGTSSRWFGSTGNGQSAWVADSNGATTRIGFLNSDHTGTNNYQSSFARAINEAGAIIGSSQRRLGTNHNGQSAWVANTSGTLTRLGYTDAIHTGTNNYQESDVVALNEAGVIIGYSSRRLGSASNGESTWVANTSGIATRIGFVDAQHTGTNGYQQSWVEHLNEAGDILGRSARRSGSTSLGQSAWVANTSGVTTRIGLVSSEHTSGSGFQESWAERLNNAGDIIGFSTRYVNNGLSNGRSAWIANRNGVTTRIGLIDAAHTSGSQRFSSAAALNEAGYVIGVSSRFSAGQSAWVANRNGVTTRIGFTDAQHTGSGNYQLSEALRINEAGDIIGYSERRLGSGANGRSTWVGNTSGTVTRIGLIDAEHTGTNNYQSSWASELNEAGDVIGYSERRLGGSINLGSSAWVANPSALTTRIGLYDAAHTRTDGFASSSAIGLTESGFAWGFSNRYTGATAVGQTAWIFDLATDLQHDLVFSVRTSDNYAYSNVNTILESGLGLGTYTLFDAAGATLGNRAFAWLPEAGGFDVGENLDVLISTVGWDFLTSANFGTLSDFFLGYGDPLGTTGQGVYLVQLSQIPEPATYAACLAIAVLAGTVWQKRRRRPVRERG